MSADLIRRLIAAGVDDSIIDEVAELVSEVRALQSRRTNDAKRQKTFRDRHNVNNVTNVTSRESRESRDAHIYREPLKEESKKVKNIYARTLPDDWALSDADKEYARSKGWPESRIETEGERFKNHAHANGRKQKNWAAAWRNWVTSPLQQARASPPPRPQTTAREQRNQDWDDARRELREFAYGQTDSGEMGGPVVPLLSTARRG